MKNKKKKMEGFVSLDVGDMHYGEIRGSKKQYTVISPSIHPDGNEYTIIDDSPIAEITEQELLDALGPYISEVEADFSSTENTFLTDEKIPISKVIDLSGYRINGNGQLQGPHPFHDSTTQNNFCINSEQTLWYCFRHRKGGTALHLIAMKDGIIECGQKLDGDTLSKTLEIAKTKYGLTIADIYKSATKPMTFDDIADILEQTIKKDRINKLITFCGMLLTYTDDSQFNISFKAPSSTGKSHIPLEVMQLFPRYDIKLSAYSSPTSFYHENGYWDKQRKAKIIDLSKKIMIFVDQPHDDLLKRLRPLASHDQKELKYTITDKTAKSGLRAKTVIVIGFPTIIFCTGKLSSDEQEATRCFVLSPETTDEKLLESITLKVMKDSNPDVFRKWLESNPERINLARRIRLIRDQNIKQIIIRPEDTKRIIQRFIKDRKLKPLHQREVGRLLELIKVSALLNLWHRERDTDGNVITNSSDVDAGFSVWEKVAETQDLGISPYVYNIYNEVFLPLGREKYNSFLRKDVSRKHQEVYGKGINDWKLKIEIIPQLESSGLIIQEQDEKNKRRYVIKIPALDSKPDRMVHDSSGVDKNTNDKEDRNETPLLNYTNDHIVLSSIPEKECIIIYELEEIVEKNGIKNDEFMKIYDNLLKRGIIFEPQPGIVKRV